MSNQATTVPVAVIDAETVPAWRNWGWALGLSVLFRLIFFWLLKNCGHLKIRTELHRRKCGTELFGLRLFRFGFGHERTNRTKLLQ